MGATLAFGCTGYRNMCTGESIYEKGGVAPLEGVLGDYPLKPASPAPSREQGLGVKVDCRRSRREPYGGSRSTWLQAGRVELRLPGHIIWRQTNMEETQNILDEMAQRIAGVLERL